MELICIRECFRANKKQKHKQENVCGCVSEQSAKQNAASLSKTGRNHIAIGKLGRWGSGRCLNIWCREYDLHLYRWARMGESCPSLRSYLHQWKPWRRSLQSFWLLENVVLCTVLLWWIKIRFFSKMRSVNILWVITRWICVGKMCFWDLLLLTSEVQI